MRRNILAHINMAILPIIDPPSDENIDTQETESSPPVSRKKYPRTDAQKAATAKLVEQNRIRREAQKKEKETLKKQRREESLEIERKANEAARQERARLRAEREERKRAKREQAASESEEEVLQTAALEVSLDYDCLAQKLYERLNNRNEPDIPVQPQVIRQTNAPAPITLKFV